MSLEINPGELNLPQIIVEEVENAGQTVIDGEVKKEEKTIASSALTNMESLIICEVPDEDKNSAFGDYGDSSDDSDSDKD